MRVVLTALACLVLASDAQAQRIIYDAKRDATAQEAVAAAKEVTSGALFTSMLKNVDEQAKLEVETVTAFVLERMRAKLNALEVWRDLKAVPVAVRIKPGEPFSVDAVKLCQKSVDCQLSTLRQAHQSALDAAPMVEKEIQDRLKRIETRTAEIEAELKKLKEASNTTDPFIVRAFEVLEDRGGDLLKYAQKIADLAKDSSLGNGLGNALTAIEQGLDQILALYKAISSIWVGQKAVSVDPASLRPSPQQIELQLLAVEQAHLETLARINARKELEVGTALLVVKSAINQLQTVLKRLGQSPGPIEATLREAAVNHNRQALLEQWSALHEAASALAQLDAANTLAEFRVTDEARRYSILRSTVNTSTYDLTIQAAVQRLALYWKGGIKPTELAQFVFYVTNSIAVPAIAIKQE